MLNQNVSLALLIFAKNPLLGKVKTRLARTLGDENALVIYQHLLNITRQNTDLLRGVTRHLFYSDFIDHTDEWQNAIYQKHLQQGIDLGARMYNAFSLCWKNASHLIIIGSDCPTLNTDIITLAFNELHNHNFVIGAATDGGYYLLGINKNTFITPPQYLFENMVWSTSDVLTTTLHRIEVAQKNVFLLPTLTDVDEEKDWLQFVQTKK